MTTLHTMVGAAVAAVCLLPLAQDRAAAPAKPTVAAVVDIIAATEQYPKWIRFRGQLREMEQRATARMEEMRKGIDEIKATMQSVGAESLERKQAEFQYENSLRAQDWEAKMWRDRIDLENARMMLVCFDDVAAVIGRVAKARGIQIVHRLFDPEEAKGDPLTIPAREVMQRYRLVQGRHVWYAAPDVDLTADVIKELQVALPDDNGAAGTPTNPEVKPEPPKVEPREKG